MCLGIPMQVVETRSGHALCREGNETRWIDTRLIDPPAPGDWLLVFLDAARERIDAERAARVGDALAALAAVQRGDLAALDDLFADLVQQEPQLPPHLREHVPAKESA